MKTYISVIIIVLLGFFCYSISFSQDDVPQLRKRRASSQYISSRIPESLKKKLHLDEKLLGESGNAVDSNQNLPISHRRNTSSTNSGENMSALSVDSIQPAWVKQYGSRSVRSDDSIKAIACDAHGNVYITGCSDGADSWHDFVTIKYNSNGDQLWVARYNDIGNNNDDATALALDSLGNVYVTGSTLRGNMGEDFLTIKYNSLGETQWVRRYNGSDNGNDGATAIAVDSTGNVYVTGYSSGSNTGYDYVTVKYNSNGDSLWAQRYDGPLHGDDTPVALTIDKANNVYVTGNSLGITVGTDSSIGYLTIKYNSHGDTSWVRRYNGPEYGGNNQASAIAVDQSGNVYITGQNSNDFGYEYSTIKYNSSGNLVWDRGYPGSGGGTSASAIAVDPLGNIYVTGSWKGIHVTAYATIKYKPNGDTIWVRLLKGSVSAPLYATALAVNSAGEVYVTGFAYGYPTMFYTTVKYDASGVTLWTANDTANGDIWNTPPALAIDSAGNAYVGGFITHMTTGNDYLTIKYNSGGAYVWAREYTGENYSYDVANALSVDGSGNVYLTGESGRSFSDRDFLTIKYDTNGDTLWVSRYDGPGNNDDEAVAIAVDSSGNVYVTGPSIGSGTGHDFATIKYNSTGDTVWVRRYNGTGNSDDVPCAVAVDSSGNVYVTGYSVGAGTGNDFATIKYNAVGNTEWVRTYNGPGNDDDHSTALAIDNEGNVLITGTSMGSGSNYDYTTIKYDRNGDSLWVRRYNGPNNSEDNATALKTDSSGNVFVTGYCRMSGSSYYYTTIKYYSNGDRAWVSRYYWYHDNYATDLAVDNSGNVYVSGMGGSTTVTSMYTTIKYNTNGDTVWVRRYADPFMGYDVPEALAVDNKGSVYVTGRCEEGLMIFDYVTIKYNSTGNIVWIGKYDGAGDTFNEATGLAVDNSGNVFITGVSYKMNRSILTTLKYIQSLDGVIQQTFGIPKTYSLDQNYPNPFNPNTTFGFRIAERGLVTLKVYDLLGRVVATIVNQTMQPGTYNIPWDATNYPSGVYIYKLEATLNTNNNFSQVRKMLLLK